MNEDSFDLAVMRVVAQSVNGIMLKKDIRIADEIVE